MNIIFLTICRIGNIEEKDIYCDLMRKFKMEGHNVWVVYPRERRFNLPTEEYEQIGINMLGVKTLNIQKTNVIEKGIGTLLVESQFKKSIKKHFGKVKFDLILYSTPPITFTAVIRYLKRKNPNAVSYLMLKDIFPQNAVDIGLFGQNSLFNKYFRKKEVALYKATDVIGCMSPANVAYVIKHNSYYPANQVEVCANAVELKHPNGTDIKEEELKRKNERHYIRKKYNLPSELPIFIYGGNLGKPQGIDFLIRCLETIKNRKDCYFVIVGNGTEYDKIANWYKDNNEGSVKLMSRLPKEDYDMLVRSCDVGLIFLDHRFTIPNYPSRLINYLEAKMPILCATDPNTDIGSIAETNGYGYWCESVDPKDFVALVDKMLTADRTTMGERGFEFLKNNYLVEQNYQTIIRHLHV